MVLTSAQNRETGRGNVRRAYGERVRLSIAAGSPVTTRSHVTSKSADAGGKWFADTAGAGVQELRTPGLSASNMHGKRRQTAWFVRRGEVLCHADLSRQYRPTTSFVLGNGRIEAKSLALWKIALQPQDKQGQPATTKRVEMLWLQSTLS